MRVSKSMNAKADVDEDVASVVCSYQAEQNL